MLNKHQLISEFIATVVECFPEARRVNPPDLRKYGYDVEDVCFVIATHDNCGICLRADASFETWNLGGSQATRSFATAIRNAVKLVREYAHSPQAG